MMMRLLAWVNDGQHARRYVVQPCRHPHDINPHTHVCICGLQPQLIHHVLDPGTQERGKAKGALIAM